MTVAHEIYLGRKQRKNGSYRNPFITIWHVDPEKDGTDDSCGWFKRARHLDQEVFKKIVKEFEFNFKNNYWFNEAGYPVFSTIGTVINMYAAAAWIIFEKYKGRKKHHRFMNKNLYDIIRLAENPTDSLHSSIVMKYGVESKSSRVEHFASIIYADIMRKIQPWYKHPRWHIHHWRIQFHPWKNFYRRFIQKCSECGKRGFKGAAYSDWSGTKVWCGKCNSSNAKKVPEPQINAQ